MNESRTIAIISLIIGVIIRYAIARRKFNRRAITGLEVFRSFERALLITFVEGLAKWIGNILILAGILLLLASCR